MIPVRRLLAVALLGAAPVAQAQVVRGRVTEVNTANPVPGALMSLLGVASDSVIVSGLSTREGDYALRAPAAGSYRLAVKRIGVRRFVSASFTLADGETRALNVPIDAIAMALPAVTVSGLCVPRARELPRVASLWDEARTALEAAEISLRDRLIQARISRYAAEVDPASLRALFDWRSDAEVMAAQPFSSLSGDSLSALGYWRALPGDSVEFLAPDARALASNAFLRDHCFGLAAAPRNRPDLVGLTFTPARERQLPDIMGTIWLDARRFELRFIEFRYTRLPPTPDANRVGGEVHFARLESGAWIVDRWFIRMPQTVTSGGASRRQLREEGGVVHPDAVATSRQLASLAGTVRDSLGRPLAGALVRAIGTHRQALTRADGAFSLDSLPAGPVSIAAHVDGYDAFATLAASRRLELPAARTTRLDLRAARGADLRREFCPASAARGRFWSGVVRLVMVDSASMSPLPGVRFLATWPAAAENPSAGSTERLQQAMTDVRGAATFCELPTDVDVEISLLGADRTRTFVLITRSTRDGVTGHVVAGRVNR